MEEANFLLVLQLKALGLPPPSHHAGSSAGELKFHPTRKWRFDFAWRSRRIAVEIDGEGFFSRVSGQFVPGRHHRTVGYRKDLEKLNEATAQGWRVYRFTPAMVKNGQAAKFLERVLARGKAATA